MRIIEVQFAPWDQGYFFKPADEEGGLLSLGRGDRVVARTLVGIDLGLVIEAGELAEAAEGPGEIKPVSRQATGDDLLHHLELNKDKEARLAFCGGLVKKYQLDMKLVDCQQSFDGQRLVFAFIADGRIDFRDLAKELTKKYSLVVRLHQIGVRDEARFKGDMGPCGKPLCCKMHLKELGNVTTDYAKCQQIAHRGSERLSGVCDRLKCCLRYEQAVYEELGRKFPAIGSVMKTQKGSGEVIFWHTLKGTVDVNLGTAGEPNIVEVPVKQPKV